LRIVAVIADAFIVPEILAHLGEPTATSGPMAP